MVGCRSVSIIASEALRMLGACCEAGLSNSFDLLPGKGAVMEKRRTADEGTFGTALAPLVIGECGFIGDVETDRLERLLGARLC
jgi:hypothetical protein